MKKKKTSIKKPAKKIVLSKSKIWTFRLFAICLVFVFLLLLEIILRLCGYGFPTSFFLKNKIKNNIVLSDNPQYGVRFFPRLIARAPTQFTFPLKKSPNTYRVFVLGESAAMGEPAYEFGFSRILQAMLEDYFPDKKIEVVNTAMTAINSHVIREIAKECTVAKPDLFIIYMGNNEVVGPYGVGTIFGKFNNSLFWIRSQIFIKSLKIGQVVTSLIKPDSRKIKNPKTWEGMAMFLDNQVRADTPGLSKTYDYFNKNLQDICKAAVSSGAKVAICTVGVNLKDCSPFGSLHRVGLSEADSGKWDNFFNQGKKLEESGKLSQAISQYQQAENLDNQYAELIYRLARCFYNLEKYEQAKKYFRFARDLDVLRFRADTKINNIIRDSGAIGKNRGIVLVDTEKALDENSLGGISGEEFFYEHVHLNFDGNYIIASEIFKQLFNKDDEKTLESTLTKDFCAKRLGYNGWYQYFVAATMIQWFNQPPFTYQLGNDIRKEKLNADLKKLSNFWEEDLVKQQIDEYRKLLNTYSDDWLLHNNFATILQNSGSIEEEILQRRLVIEFLPYSVEARCSLAMALGKIGKPKEAINELQQALRFGSQRSEIYTNIGLMLALSNEAAAAKNNYKKALKINPYNAETLVNFGSAILSDGDIDSAVKYYDKAIELQIPSASAKAYYNLAMIAEKEKNIEKAINYYNKALEYDTDYFEALRNLGLIFADKGNFTQAANYFHRALQVNATSADIFKYLGMISQGEGKIDEAMEYYNKAISFSPNISQAHYYLANILRELGKTEEAIFNYNEELKVNIQDKESIFLAHYNLASIYYDLSKSDMAISHYKQALILQPDNWEVCNRLAWIMINGNNEVMSEDKEAMRLAEKACKITSYNNPVTLITLAMAYGKLQLFDKAIEVAAKARELSLSLGQNELAETFKSLLELYNDKK